MSLHRGDRIPDADIERARSVGLVDFIGQHVELKKSGDEHKGLCPFHGEKSPSFTVTPDEGYFCFGCGAGGHDVISFVEKLYGIDFRSAVQRINGDLPVGYVAPVQRPSLKQDDAIEWQPIVPVPADCSRKPMATFHFEVEGVRRKVAATSRFDYLNADGALIGCVFRFDIPGGGKQVLPQSYCLNTKTGEMQWRWLSFGKPRPLFGLDKLAAHPGAQVMVVEGEKTADAAQALYEAAGISRDKLVTVSWPGGGKAAKRVDWSPLAGRAVALWPDADQQDYPDTHALAGQRVPFLEQPGTVCMLDIASRIEASAKTVKIILPPEGVEAGWDLADSLPEGFNLLAHTKASALLLADFRERFKLEQAEQGTMPRHSGNPALAATDSEVGGEERRGSETIDRQMILQPHDFPDLSAKMRPLNTIPNLAALMRNFKITARYNMISKETELSVPGLWGTEDNAQNVRLAHLNSLAAHCSLPRENLVEYTKAIADMNAYNPVVDWIKSKPWDGVSRIQDLADTLICASPEFRTLLVRRWLISCAAALSHGGFWTKGVLTLHGAQDLGKTSWFRRLVPAELGAFREGVSLDSTNKDSVMTAVSHWIVELGELESTLRRDMENLKAFISQTTDRLRRPYDRVDSEYPRRTVFCASVNSQKFLKDDTGNGRFWVIEVDAVKHDHDVDMQQLWAEVMSLYLAGEQWHLTPSEKAQLNAGNEKFRQVSPIEELLTTHYDLAAPQARWIPATSLLLELGYDKPSRAQATEAGQTLHSLGVPKRILQGRTVYRIPDRLTGPQPYR